MAVVVLIVKHLFDWHARNDVAPIAIVTAGLLCVDGEPSFRVGVHAETSGDSLSVAVSGWPSVLFCKAR